jgi:hypothetical protein
MPSGARVHDRMNVYPSLQLLLQVGDIHLVRDAIGVADALHIAVLNKLFQTPHHGNTRQRVGDLTGANGREVFNGWLCDKRGPLRDYRATSGVLHQSNL